MALARPMVIRNGLIATGGIMPGDIMGAGESLTAGALATAGNGIWTGAMIGTGIIRRTGPGANYTDTTDTSTNILAALAGNGNTPNAVPGSTFRVRLLNTVGVIMTFAAGAGVVVGLGTLDVTGTQYREYLFTILNASSVVVAQSNTTNASAVVTFVIPPNMTALPIGPGVPAYNITPGMVVSGTGITAGTTVLGITQGVGGIIGVTLSAAATATSVAGGVSLTFSPSVRIDSLGSGNL